MTAAHKRKRVKLEVAANGAASESRKPEKRPRKTKGHAQDVSDGHDAIRNETHVITNVEEDDGSDLDSRSQESGEEDEWIGFGDEGSTAREPKPEVALDSQHKSNRPPTALELRDIKDASNLYRSSSFKLQIDALLPNVRPKYHRVAPLERFLHALHACLTSAPPTSSISPLVASKKLSKQGIYIPYPLPQPTEDAKWTVAFAKPVDIVLVGSWANKLSVKARDAEKYVVDVALEMPSSLFQEKDYLHGRFFHKKAFYLALVAATILNKHSGLNADVLYSTSGEDIRQTCLIVRPKGENSLQKLHAEIRILLFVGSDCPIPLQRLAPTRSNLRTASDSEGASETLSSPLYNNTLLLSWTPRSHLLVTHLMKQKVSAYEDAHTLLRVWANQRGYGRGSRMCVRGFEGKGQLWAAVLDLLVHGEDPSHNALNGTVNKRKPVGTGLSSYQLFRAALDFLARSDLPGLRAFVKNTNSHRFPAGDYDTFDAVLVDSQSPFNHLAGIPLGSLSLLQRDAKATLEALNESALSEDPFNEVFLKEHRDIQTRFDVIMRIDLNSAKLRNKSVHAVLDQGSSYTMLLSIVDSTLRTALGNRAKSVTILHPTSQPWALSDTPPLGSPVIFIGLILDTEQAFRLVDHGPAEDSPDPEAAKAFQEFWGDKAELRRFKDGKITESVVWNVKTSDERAHIPFFICTHILQRHCGIPEGQVQHWQRSFDNLLRLPESITSLYQAEGVEMGFKAALAAFDSLIKTIKGLDDKLPLAILNVSPASDALRYTSAFSPIALPDAVLPSIPYTAQYLQPMEIVIEFEKSGRWPDELRAIQKLKLAFFEHLASTLMTAVPGLKANVVLGNPATTPDIQDSCSLEIKTPQGWVFNARIWHDREAKLLDTAIDDKPHIPQHIKKKLSEEINLKERQIATEAKEVYLRRFVHAPRHHRAIAALSHRFSAFSGAVRLVKRWLSSHWLLGTHISGEAVELLCAVAFIGRGKKVSNPAQLVDVPGTKERAFFKVVEFLKDWEWEGGLFVPLYNDDQVNDTESALATPIATKGAAWTIATEFDPSGRMWTSHGPDPIAARRVTTIARGTWKCSLGVEGAGYNVVTLFTHPQEDYDILIDLEPSVIPRYSQNLHGDIDLREGRSFVNAQRSEENAPAGFDPARMLFDDLTRTYQDTIKVFYDCLGGDRFGIIWEPSVTDPKPFRAMNRFSSTPVRKNDEHGKDKDKMVTLNTDSILSEMERLGAGLIKTITQQK